MSTIAHSLRDYREPTKVEQSIISFGLPTSEVPQDEIPAVLSLSNPVSSNSKGADAVDQAEQEDQVYAGRLILSRSFLCFSSLDRRSCRLSLPLYTVRRVERLNVTNRGGVFALAVVVWHGMRVILRLDALRPQCEAFCSVLRDNLRGQLGSMKLLKSFAAACFSEMLLQESFEDGKRGNANSSAREAESTAGSLLDKDPTLDKDQKELIDAPPPPPDYHAGLGARFKYPGDPRKLREKSKMKLWKDYLRGV